MSLVLFKRARVRFNLRMQIPDIDTLSFNQLKGLVLGILEELARISAENESLRAENNRLKGLKGKPDIKPSVPPKPSGMEKGTEGLSRKERRKKKRDKAANPQAKHEERIVKVSEVPPGSQFKGYETYSVHDLTIEVKVIHYRRERWVTPDGQTVIAALPPDVSDHFGPELKRFILAQYHSGQTTIPRLVQFLNGLGFPISKRQVVRFLIEDKDDFMVEARDVLRAGLGNADWISVDDTGARHKGRNGYCTQIGNDRFTFFATTTSKSRINFLSLLRAGHTDYVLNGEAFAYMRKRNLSATIINQLMAHPDRHFANEEAWQTHLKSLGIPALKVTPDPVAVATEGALWGAVVGHGFVEGSVILSDDAGQFNVGIHALCWIHAERLVHKLDTFTEAARLAKEQVRAAIWTFYADLKAYRKNPEPARKIEFRASFDAIFQQKTSFVALDRLLSRLHANKEELLRVLDYPMIPLHTNSTETDVRAEVTRRKVSAGTRSDDGRDCRDTFLGLMKTCQKLGISFWDYLGDRLKVPGTPSIPSLASLVAQPP
jgi:hemerythrin